MSVEGHASTEFTLPLISYSYAYAVVSKSEVCSCWHFTCESCIEECTAWIWSKFGFCLGAKYEDEAEKILSTCESNTVDKTQSDSDSRQD